MNENKDRVRELFLEGCKDDALRLAYEWVKTRRWTLREFFASSKSSWPCGSN